MSRGPQRISPEHVGRRVRFKHLPDTYPKATIVEVKDNWVKCHLDKTITFMGYEEEEKMVDMNDSSPRPRLRTDLIVFDHDSIEFID